MMAASWRDCGIEIQYPFKTTVFQKIKKYSHGDHADFRRKASDRSLHHSGKPMLLNKALALGSFTISGQNI
jgi:hypothetical protein